MSAQLVFFLSIPPCKEQVPTSYHLSVVGSADTATDSQHPFFTFATSIVPTTASRELGYSADIVRDCTTDYDYSDYGFLRRWTYAGDVERG